MSAAFTVLLPHRRNKGNDAALHICLDCLMQNTVSDFKLIIDAATDQPLYERVNRMVEQATTEACVYWASDCFAAPAWDVPMLDLYDAQTFVTPVLVEPGAIALHAQNIHKDFGRKPETFNRAAFEAWAEHEAPALNLQGTGWYAPYLFPRDGWLAAGGLQTALITDHHGFTSADMELFDRWTAAGNRILRARSYVFHLQRWSEPEEQMDAKRNI